MPIGEFVLDEACRRAAAHRGRSSMHVNLSAVELQHVDVLERVTDDARAPPASTAEQLVLEITESVLVDVAA